MLSTSRKLMRRGHLRFLVSSKTSRMWRFVAGGFSAASRNVGENQVVPRWEGPRISAAGRSILTFLKRGEGRGSARIETCPAEWPLKSIDNWRRGPRRYWVSSRSRFRICGNVGSTTTNASAGACDCALKPEDTAGTKMRVHLKAATLHDLAARYRSFGNTGS